MINVTTVAYVIKKKIPVMAAENRYVNNQAKCVGANRRTGCSGGLIVFVIAAYIYRAAQVSKMSESMINKTSSILFRAFKVMPQSIRQQIYLVNPP